MSTDERRERRLRENASDRKCPYRTSQGHFNVGSVPARLFTSLLGPKRHMAE
jgi:hypothetical protein